MEVTVNYLSQLKQVASIASEKVVLAAPYLVQDLVTQLAQKHGEPLSSFLLNAEGTLNNSILVIIGDTQVHWETPVRLKEGDVVSFISPLAGG
ncbi:MAG: MoaD/ThiS family protein [Cyanothece sp. SIO1E1]|nr:MoaD/ThiS family protein [Cyanothece sp. SIO1E1]